jgi:L-threonylcarbamoyladenylate synthase
MKRVPLESLLALSDQRASLKDLLACDGVVAMPTETYYALGVNPASPQAVARLLKIKGRPPQKALPILFTGRDQFAKLGITAPPATVERFFSLWPAPVTVIFETRSAPPCGGGDRSLAVREPAHEALRRLLKVTGPLTGTSANPSGMPPLSDPNEVALAFGAVVDLLIDGGATEGLKPSTLLDARFDPPRLLREGAFPWPPR